VILDQGQPLVLSVLFFVAGGVQNLRWPALARLALPALEIQPVEF
jgi:hypothetical protein